MSRSAKAEAVLALHRFGMGPRPGSIAAIEADPRGALIAELDRPATANRGRQPAFECQGLSRGDRRQCEAASQGDRRQERTGRETPADGGSVRDDGRRRARARARWRRRWPPRPSPIRAGRSISKRRGFASRPRSPPRSASPSGWSGSGPTISASRPTRSRACPAPTSARPSALTCSAASPTCCWPPRAIRRCCSISTRRFRWARIRPPASTAAAASTRISRARSWSCIRWACGAATPRMTSSASPTC